MRLPDKSRMFKICAIVLAYGSRTDVAQAIQSLQAAEGKIEIVVVQNGLADSELDWLAQAFPFVSFVRNARNCGAAGGRNLALRTETAAKADYFFFLDRDATIEPNAITKLVEAEGMLPDAALLSTLILVRENPAKIHSAGGTIDARTFDEVHYHHAPTRAVMPVDFVVTTAALVSRHVLEQVGLFDERYFAYYEDLDWAHRAKILGFNHYVVRDAIGYHNQERSRFHPLVSYYISRNRLLFLTKHKFLESKFTKRTWEFILQQIGNGLGIIFSLRPPSLTCFVAQLQGVFDYLRGRYGRAPRWTETPTPELWEVRFWIFSTHSQLFNQARKLKRTIRSKGIMLRG